ncbi:MAG TPA: hypothetical protein ENG10_02580, partial [Candidatus Bathyarchaeota archaeon]|nr:hypothetical protein [Candidatus Bathyarchaeota archaeon]HEX69163.1 hypothetical protein [Candidatus Bathyarchaeota archaeon]
QKAPYNGIGINQPSDPFSPNEKVIIYAKVTYNEGPCPSQLVTFAMFPPSSDLPFILSNWTDENGIAMCIFRVHLTYMGQWTVNVTTSIGQDISSYDILMFNVTWIVNIEHVQILDKNFWPKDTFIHGEAVNIGLELENEALSSKNVTIEATFFDSTGTCIMNVRDIAEVFHGNNMVFITGGKIPSWAMTGNASLTINIYDRPPELGGQPYSPGVSETFRIGLTDLAIVEFAASPTQVRMGEPIKLTIKVRNEGEFTQTFNLHIFVNESLTNELPIKDLEAGSQRIVILTLNTSSMSVGTYVVKAYIPPVYGEKDISDNEKTVSIRVIVIPPDIAITSFSVDKTEVAIGENLTFYVSVLNNGSSAEDFNLYIRLNETDVISFFVEGLAPNEERHLTITFNTSEMAEGRYILKAYVPPILGEENVQNNEYIDGIVTLISPSPPSMWNLFLILLVIILLLLLFISLCTLRKREKKR